MYKTPLSQSRSSGTLVSVEAKQLPVVYVGRKSPRTTSTTYTPSKSAAMTPKSGYVTGYDTVASFSSSLHPAPANLATSSRFPTSSNLRKDYSPVRSPTSPMSANAVSGVTGSYGGATAGPSGYRYASVDRLTQRSKIYDTGLTPVNQQPGAIASLSTSAVDLHNHLAALSAKRELFFRNDGSSPATANGTALTSSVGGAPNPSTTSATGLPSTLKDGHYGRDKERDGARDRDKDGTSTALALSTGANKEMEGYVGFANLPNQVYRKAVKKGFEFTLMAVGESGLGKSTLINSMFLTDVYSNEYPGPSARIKKTVQVEASNVILKEGGVNLTLTIVDTPGFGDAVDNSECWAPITNYIESKYEEYLNAESRVYRSPNPDSRVHCCLYFFAPTCHGLKPLDIEFMKRLHDKVNIIPIIAKADTMTPEECSTFKRTILSEIAQNKIKIYEFPDCDDEEENKQQKILKERVPFAVVGSNTVIEVNGKKVRGRKYPWGVAEVENMEHCDFIALRNMIIRTHMQDLKDVTNNVHYENFRCRKLAGVGEGKQAKLSNKNPLAQMEEEKKEHENKMKRMEQEMEQVFEMKVREKMQKLKDSEADLQRRHEQMKKSLEQQRQELDDKRKAFEKERMTFDLANKDIEDALRRMSLDTNSKEQLDGKEKKKEKKKGLF